jgi:hypothetical protein
VKSVRLRGDVVGARDAALVQNIAQSSPSPAMLSSTLSSSRLSILSTTLRRFSTNLTESAPVAAVAASDAVNNSADSTEQRLKGVVANYYKNKGFGFIKGPSNFNHFVHHTQIVGKGFRMLLRK